FAREEGSPPSALSNGFNPSETALLVHAFSPRPGQSGPTVVAGTFNENSGQFSSPWYRSCVASLLSGLLGILVATNQSVAVSNLVEKTTGAKIEVVDPNDPVEREYLKLLEQDNAAQAEVDRWISESEKLAEKGAATEEGV